MGLKGNLFILFIIVIILFPFFFSKKEIKFKKEINLATFIIKDGKFKIYNKKVEKSGNFKNLNYYNNNNYLLDNAEIKFFDKNSSLKSKKIVYNGVYNLKDAIYKTIDYKYIAEKAIYDDKQDRLIAYNFEFFNQKIDGKGDKMIYQNNILKADNIKYNIKGLK